MLMLWHQTEPGVFMVYYSCPASETRGLEMLHSSRLSLNWPVRVPADQHRLTQQEGAKLAVLRPSKNALLHLVFRWHVFITIVTQCVVSDNSLSERGDGICSGVSKQGP